MSFDVLCCTTIINGQDQFQLKGYDWCLVKDSSNRLTLESEYWNQGFPHTYLFQPLNDSGTILGLRNEFVDFKDNNLISGDLQYRILSTLAMPYEYKLLLYSLVKLPKHYLNRELHRLQMRGDDIYDKLIEYVQLYEGSPLFYEDEWQRFMKLKARQNKKLLKLEKATQRL